MKKRRQILVLAICICTLFVTGCSAPQKKGTEALEEGNYEEAAAQFQEAAQSDNKKTSAAGFEGLGMTYYETGDYSGALEAFESAADAGAEQTVQLYHLMGVCAMQTSDYEKALEYLKSGLALTESGSGEEPDADMIREMKYNEIICCEQLADWETARDKAEAYMESYPDDQDMQRELEFLKTR